MRTSSGKDITAVAITTARQVNTISTPKRLSIQRPSRPRLPSSFRSTRPVATGGITRGRVTMVSTKIFPRQCFRASSHPSAIPGGRISNVPAAATHVVNQATCQTSKDMPEKFAAGFQGLVMKPYLTNTDLPAGEDTRAAKRAAPDGLPPPAIAANE